MSLPHAILTALLEKPSSGLELTRRFDKSIGFFWSATHQQIYRELSKLEQAGLIRALPSASPARGQRREYEVLPAGREELASWTAKPQDPKPLREVLGIRLRAAAVIGTAGVAEEVRRHLALHRRQLAEYTEIERRDFPAGLTDPGDRLRHVVLRGGIEAERFWIGWLSGGLAELEAIDAESARPERETAPETGQEQGQEQT